MTENNIVQNDVPRVHKFKGISLNRIYQREQPCQANAATEQIVDAFERVLLDRKSEALLIWPQRPEEVSIVHSFAALNRIAECDQKQLATLFFPWVRGIGATQRVVLLDRANITKECFPALSREMLNKKKGKSFNYLMSLHSMKHVFTSGKKNTRLVKALEIDPGLEHPTLFEIMPQVNIEETKAVSFEGHFLRRLQKHTWISETEHILGAVDPLKTPFIFFGAHAKSVRVKSFRAAGLDPKHSGRKPDIILLDVTRSGRNRLGRDWKKAVARFLNTLWDLYGEDCPPLLAVTDDVFALQILRWETLKEYGIRRKEYAQNYKKPAKAQVVLNASPDPFDHQTISSPLVPEITAEVYGSDVLSFVSFGVKLKRLLAEAGEEELSECVMSAVDIVQNLIGLPGSPRPFFKFLDENYEGFERATMGARFDYLPSRGKIKTALTLGAAGSHHKDVTDFLTAYDKICTALSTNNPGSDLFDECVKGLARKSSKSILIFSSELVRGFAEWRIENDSKLAEVKDSLGRKVLLLDKREAIEELRLSHKEQKAFQRIVFIEPYADDFLLILTRQWLPPKVTIFCNLARAENILRRLKILLEIDGIEPVKEILVSVEGIVQKALDGRNIDFPDLDSSPMPIKFGTLDLTALGSSTGPTRIIQTSGDFQIRAFDGSEMALYTPDSLQAFSRKLAKDLKEDEQICVFSPDFVGMAREKLNLRANAPEILVQYHKAVLEAAAKLPGDSFASKIEFLDGRMRHLDPTLQMPGPQSIRSWIDVEHLITAPRDELKPHAPKDRRRFLTFMKALEIDDALAKNYWDFGVFWTRSMRIKNGAAFHQVFMGILIDPYGAANSLPPASRQDVWRIYETAEHHIVTIKSNEREEKL